MGAGLSTVASLGGASSMGMLGMRPGGPQCRQQPPAYKVAQHMAKLHRFGRAHSHEGVTFCTDHEDGT